MSGKAAKARRLEKRRNEKRHGLTDREFRVYQECKRSGYSHDSAMAKVKDWRISQLPFKEQHKAKTDPGYSPLLGKKE